MCVFQSPSLFRDYKSEAQHQALLIKVWPRAHFPQDPVTAIDRQSEAGGDSLAELRIIVAT